MFITPPELPDGRTCRVIKVPSSLYWLGIFNKAITQTMYAYNYKQVYDDHMTPDECAAVGLDIYVEYLASTCEPDAAPYWDDPDAADATGETPTDEPEPWYFALVDPDETLQANIENWFIAAFVAEIAGIPSAIVFLTIAKQFRLAWRTRDWGGIVKIFIDTAQIGEVDTYSATPGIAYFDVTAAPPDSEPTPRTLMIKWDGSHNPDATPDENGDYRISYIRKQLVASEVIPDGTRWDEECDCIQQTPDGGDTWIDNPGLDPRTNPGSQLPPRGGSDPRCDAAENAVSKLEDLINAIVLGVSDGQIAMTLLDICLLFIPGIQILIALLWAVSELLLAIGTTVIAAAFDSDTYDTIKCIFYCNMQPDGTVTADDLASILSDIADQIGGTAQTVCDLIIGQVWKEVGLTNAGIVGDEVGDCDTCACGWCFEMDFTTTDGGFVPVNLSGTDFAVYSAGVGWTAHIQEDGCSNHAYIYMRYAFGGTIDNLGEITMDFTLPYYEGTVHFYDQRLGGSIVSRQSCGTMITSPQTVTLDPVPCNELDVTINGCNMPGSMTITKLTFRGFGECPFGTPNCE